MISLYLKDDQFEDHGFNHVREVVRAIVFNEENKLCLNHLLFDDMFGHRDYFELPGGGLDINESPEDGLKREILEEVGVHIKDISQIGEVTDFYNLIKRKNHNMFFIAYKDGNKEALQLEPYEQEFIDRQVWVDIDEAIRLYEETVDTPISILVKRRELPILKECRKLLQNRL